MVQCVLSRQAKDRGRRAAVVVCLVVFGVATTAASNKSGDLPAAPAPPDLILQGGRKLSYERSFSSEREVRGKPGFWTRLVNFVAGEPEYHGLVRPYGIAIDSRGRAIVSDPGAAGVHIFDFAQHKYKFIERLEKGRNSMTTPQCVALDAQDNIYVTDSVAGKIFVFRPDGKFHRVLGSLKGGEGFFKRPTGIAVDSAEQRIYVTDTLRDKIFILDLQGNVIKSIGQSGTDDGQFNLPTEVKLNGPEMVVVDAMNFRLQFLDRDGPFRGAIGKIGDGTGEMFRPKGVAIDSEGHYYVVDGLWGVVQVFDRQGRLLYYFGGRGTGAGDFQLPAGIFIDRDDRVFVVDSYNRRIQVFRYYGLSQQARGGAQ
jgi:DNA-binding beta-propeller fold protein YncE